MIWFFYSRMEHITHTHVIHISIFQQTDNTRHPSMQHKSTGSSKWPCAGCPTPWSSCVFLCPCLSFHAPIHVDPAGKWNRKQGVRTPPHTRYGQFGMGSKEPSSQSPITSQGWNQHGGWVELHQLGKPSMLIVTLKPASVMWIPLELPWSIAGFPAAIYQPVPDGRGRVINLNWIEGTGWM